MVFSAISMVSLFEADHDTNNSVSVGRESPPPPQKKNHTHTPQKKNTQKTKNPQLYVSLQFSPKRSGKNRTAQLIHPVGKGMVLYLAVSSSVVSSHTLGPFHSKEGVGGGGVAGSESFRVHCFAC